MISKNYKGRCIKRKLNKFSEVCKTYNNIQTKYAELISINEDIREAKSNVLLDDKSIGEFTTDFVCTKKDGDLMVRECVLRSNLTRPRTVKLLNFSYNYWSKRGLKDWGIVTDEEK